MLVYCDTSALVKLVVDEALSDDLDEWLSSLGQPMIASSIIARTELIRAVRRHGGEAVEQAKGLLQGISIIGLTDDLAGAASELEPDSLRSLGALHVASAQRIGPALTAVVTYDKRMVEAARAAGLTVEHPGA